ncbi:hypothetical protein GUITHDRAFT_118770 [Guillardia theta CCMP2712]|uniref:Zn(2)-C6 fungal-type domain-containing protein n=1 Tax=Guillardia theta (strain CCMP2712) TaxID=905079 RepID=L1IFI4_GUITC|nr:hypothetical protein GUITHDRAFT_118770 [Guillardia theta CCMP2712]EKX35021.1 hypothetical protein GUITHDRAFT_118770 [Guillardia theta CCMP2712]|eukprot:XP_005822001.1 hypothetical protein GUITHDRAFT_118770 [Guillardia theta CCMP2712]
MCCSQAVGRPRLAWAARSRSEGGLGHGALPPVLQRKREQVVQACERCRRSRLKCDSARPCGRCARSLQVCVDWRVKRRRRGTEIDGSPEGSPDGDKETSGYSWEELLGNPEEGELQLWPRLADETASEESIAGGGWEELEWEEVVEGSGAGGRGECNDQLSAELYGVKGFFL